MQGVKVDVGRLRELVSDKNLKKLTTAGTNNRKMVVGRIEYVRDYLV